MGKKRTRKSVRKREEEFEEEGGSINVSELVVPLEESIVENKYELLLKTSPQRDLLREIKKDTHRFYLIVLFSILLHLSAVTVFKIVVYVPRTDLQYLDMKVIQVEEPVVVTSSQLRISSDSQALGLSSGSDLIDGLVNKIELPRLEFEEMKKLTLRRTLVEETDIEEPLVKEFKDSWAQFGMGVSRIRESLSALSPFSESPREYKAKTSEISPILRQRIGNNTDITYRCLTPPYQRKILFVPLSFDITNRLGEDKSQSFEFMLEVNAEGRVMKVTDLSIEGGENLEFVKELVGKIRFEPIIETSSEDKETQQITLRFKLDVANQ